MDYADLKTGLAVTLVIGDYERDENGRNRCIAPLVQEITGFDIGEWDDGHPLNQRGTNVIDYLTSTLMPKD